MGIKVSKNIYILCLLVNSTVIAIGMIAGSNLLYLGALLIWANLMIYALNKIKNRIFLCCFGISFFVFLLGRDGLEQLFDHRIETLFPESINNHAYLSMIISLIGIWVSYIVFQKNPSQHLLTRIVNINCKPFSIYFYVRKYSRIAFFMVLPFAILLNLIIAYFVIRFGYYSSFTDLRVIMENSPTFSILSKIEMLLPTSFAIFMSTLPSKQEFKRVGGSYIIYLLITLACGARGDFVLGALLIIIFLVFMQRLQPNIVWVKKKYVKLCLFTLPLIAVGATFYKNIRFGESVEDVSFMDGFTSFFYDQGVSLNTLKRAYQYEDAIPKQDGFYSFEFLYVGIPARILGIPVYQGNTIDHATKGHSFTHAFGYTIMGNGYLMGAGPGSSYIAELYYDFGYIGVFLGSCLYGFIFTLINNFNSGGLLRRSLIFMIIPRLLWAPRSGFSWFISFLIAPTTIILVGFIFIAAQRAYKKHNKVKELHSAIDMI
ncbi:MAG: O-antigen polysaccharide polymerase Wzy family protein [Bacteroides sp.]|nr:O-antigen polysaccharide polymerase Wzy family protein [Bacteroides sp.]